MTMSSASLSGYDPFEAVRSQLSNIANYQMNDDEDILKYTQTVEVGGKQVVFTVNIPPLLLEGMNGDLEAKVVDLALKTHSMWELSYKSGITKIVLEGQGENVIHCFKGKKEIESFDLANKLQQWNRNPHKNDADYSVQTRAYEHLSSYMPVEEGSKVNKKGHFQKMQKLFTRSRKKEGEAFCEATTGEASHPKKADHTAPIPVAKSSSDNALTLQRARERAEAIRSSSSSSLPEADQPF